MRRGLTLIELIFSMVIIAIIFSVVPRFIFASNKAMQLGIKEDALFNALTQISMISRLPWDQNTIDTNGSILIASGGLTCNEYRIGGFKGSRSCIENPSALGPTDTVESAFDDLDDYNGDSRALSNARASYLLSTSVVRSGDIKSVTVTVSADSKKLGSGTYSSKFFYESANLGQVQINRRFW